MTIILFLLSIVVLFFMLAYKAFEIKVKKISFISNTWAKADGHVDTLLEVVVFKYNRYKKISQIFVFEFLPSYAYEILVKTKDYVSKRYYSAGDEFRGRRVLRSNGSVSFFLERLSNTDKSGADPRNI
jgi:hypothetical protein